MCAKAGTLTCISRGGRAAQAAVYPPALCRALARGLAEQLRRDVKDLNQINGELGQLVESNGKLAEGENGNHRSQVKRPDGSTPGGSITDDGYYVQFLDEEERDLAEMSMIEEHWDEDELKEAWDDVKGGPLDASAVVAARQTELQYLWKRAVYRYASRREALA